MTRKDPLRNFRFRVEIDGLTVAGFSEVLIGPTTTAALELSVGGFEASFAQARAARKRR